MYECMRLCNQSSMRTIKYAHNQVCKKRKSDKKKVLFLSFGDLKRSMMNYVMNYVYETTAKFFFV